MRNTIEGREQDRQVTSEVKFLIVPFDTEAEEIPKWMFVVGAKNPEVSTFPVA